MLKRTTITTPVCHLWRRFKQIFAQQIFSVVLKQSCFTYIWKEYKAKSVSMHLIADVEGVNLFTSKFQMLDQSAEDFSRLDNLGLINASPIGNLIHIIKSFVRMESMWKYEEISQRHECLCLRGILEGLRHSRESISTASKECLLYTSCYKGTLFPRELISVYPSRQRVHLELCFRALSRRFKQLEKHGFLNRYDMKS